MNKVDIFNYLESLNTTSAHNSPVAVALNLLVVFGLMLFVLLIYRFAHRGLSFSANFGFVIMLTGLVTAVIMMTIENNLALSLGMVGALSIVRFRSAIKDPLDTCFIFFSVALGLCAGTGNYILAAVSALIIGAIMLLYCVFIRKTCVHLMVVRANASVCTLVMEVLDAEKIKFDIKVKNISKDFQEYIFRLDVKGKESIVEKLYEVEGVTHVSLAYEGEV